MFVSVLRGLKVLYFFFSFFFWRGSIESLLIKVKVTSPKSGMLMLWGSGCSNYSKVMYCSSGQVLASKLVEYRWWWLGRANTREENWKVGELFQGWRSDSDFMIWKGKWRVEIEGNRRLESKREGRRYEYEMRMLDEGFGVLFSTGVNMSSS